MSKADIIFHNGLVYTVETGNPIASAMAVANGKILAVGSDNDMLALGSPTTRRINLGGRMMLPGIGDVHNHHMVGGANDLFELVLPMPCGLDEILSMVRKKAASLGPDEWIIGGAWSSELFERLGSIASLEALDAASLGRPVMLRDDSLHNRWINSRAIELCGIGPGTPDPRDGHIHRDPSTGKATGLLVELASGIAEQAIRQTLPDIAERNRQSVKRAVEILNGYGVTAYQDATTSLPILEALRTLDNAGHLNAWAVATLPAFATLTGAELVGDDLLAKREEYRSAHVRPDFVKFFMDGVPTTRTAAMLEPYLPAGDGKPVMCAPFIPVPEMVRWLRKAEALGMGIKVHCTGDAAVKIVLDAIEIVRDLNGSGPLHHIAHPGYIDPADIPRMRDLDVVADLCPAIWVPGPIINAIFAVMPSERAAKYWPLKDFHEAGVLMAGGSDWPVIGEPDPWFAMEGMLTREDPKGKFPGALWPEQKLDIETVIRINTLNPAIAMGLGKTTGSIKPGKSADMILLDRNLLETDAKQISKTRVLETWFEGRLVHQV
ncbi:MAG: amidohydrolase [Rhizobiaceae bacterium]